MPDKTEIGNVVALTLVDATTLIDGCVGPNTLVRIGVRCRNTNITHPDIVSVPTQRVPTALADALLGDKCNNWTREEIHQLSAVWVSTQSHNGHDPTIYAVESLMSTKLGVSESLEEGAITFAATPALLTTNYAHYPNLIDKLDSPYPSDELIRMINLRVHIDQGAELFPEITESYTHSRWVRASEYQRMMDGKEVSAVGLDGFKFCVDGLCVATTSHLIKHELAACAA